MSEYILNLLPLKEGEREEFKAIAPDAVHVFARSSTVTPEQLAAATVIFGWPRPEKMKEAAHLKWFQTMWAGADEYAGMLPEGVLFTSSSGSNSRSVAEHMLTCLLALCRRLPAYQDSQRVRQWKDEGPMKTIMGGTVLVAGAGHVGSDFAKLCQGLGARTVGLKRTVRGPAEGFDEVYPMDRLDELLPQADVVALVLPHSPETAGLMDARRIALMKEDAILISAGRGTVLDQNALAEAMGAGKLWGAALDVTDPEPLPPDSPLWDTPRLLLTPHVAGGMRLEITRRKCVELAQENLRRYLAGEELVNRV
ncbi:D-2-hydroxyacid dehydrogenase [Pseudoflavonifractor sp. 60]|uniref:D-2-hydroxyacid dehydrogenase n=1 Tax=Pseudoflavonifractor sp. 60 TaxID=2304576 RepID=UPI00136FAB9F|nr:D-2-hydroxyacid dehydrogenase [Pseudoflavonifractor sp. 60]NBI67672.1 D-2-hydroxyacid dehydrogenase [Pseudoflavonifractor sp. 60]